MKTKSSIKRMNLKRKWKGINNGYRTFFFLDHFLIYHNISLQVQGERYSWRILQEVFLKNPYGLSPVDIKSGVKIREAYQVLAKRFYCVRFQFIFDAVPKSIEVYFHFTLKKYLHTQNWLKLINFINVL